MSWNNVIPAELLLGAVQMVPKEVENPEVTIPDSLLTDCLISYQIGDYGMTSHADHPAFAELRRVLGARGYIHIEPNWWNGDQVLKPFRFNDHQLEIGDTFYSASAWEAKFKFEKRNVK